LKVEKMMRVGLEGKVELACLLGRHDTIGIDCVALCVNQLLCSGVHPSEVRSRLTVGKKVICLKGAIKASLEEGCQIAGCALEGPEPFPEDAEVPESSYLLDASAIGEKGDDLILAGAAPVQGDLVVGLCSAGVHADGFPIIRELFMTGKTDLSAYIPEFSRTLGDELLRPTRIYAPALDCLRRRGVHIKAASHIVGGLYASIPRMLPVGLTARIETATFPASPVFEMIAGKGKISDEEMYHTFNMGIGMAIIVAQQDVGLVKDILCCGGERNYIIGSLVKGSKDVELL